MLRHTLVYALGMLFAFPARAEDTDTLEPIVVSATRTGLSGAKVPTSITVITHDQIEASGASHLVEVLRGQGGIQITDLFGDGSRATISMRGFGGNAQANALILVDGRRLNNADLGAPDLNSITLQDIERVEIVQGSAGALYGDQAVGGVINIITRDPTRLRAGVDVDLGSYDHRSVHAAIENRHANGLGYRLSATRRNTDNYRDHNEQDYSNLVSKVDYLGKRGSVFFEYQDVNEDLETPGSLFLDQIAANRRQPLNPNDFTKTDTWAGRVGATRSLLPGWELQMEYTDRFGDSDGILSFGGVPGTFLTKRHHQEFTPRLVGSWDSSSGNVLLTVGADLFRTRFFLSSVLGTIDDEQNNLSGYARLVWPLSERLTVTLGHRHAEVENDITGALLPAGTEIDDDANASEFGLSYELNPNWRLFGRVETNYRFVLADEYTSASFGGVIPVTQTGRSAEMGSEWEFHDVTAKLALYQLDLEDEIEFDPILFINTNIGDTRRRGLIAEGSYSPLERLTFSARYSYVDPDIVSGALEGLTIPFVATHTGLLTTDYRVVENAHAYLEINGTSGRVATGDFTNSLPDAPGYVIANVSLNYKWKGVGLGMRVNNLLDKDYTDNAQTGFRAPLFLPETTRFPAPERNFFVTLSYSYE